MNTTALHTLPPPLPATTNELFARRTITKPPNINDLVLAIFGELWDKDEAFRKLFFGMWPEQCVEGSRATDDTVACLRIREYAEKKGLPLVREAKLATIRHSVHVILRRYKIDPKRRKKELSLRAIEQE